MLQCKYTYSQDTLISWKSCKRLLLSQTIYLMIKLMMEDVMVNFALSTSGGKLSFVVKSVVEPHDIWKQRQNLITFWCRITKKIHGDYHIFNQSEQSCLEMLTLDFALMVVAWFLSPPGDYFTFNQPNIKYLYVICCFYTLGLADSKKFHHVCKFIFAIIFAIMLTCIFFARNQQKHHLAVESWSFKEAATFGSRSTEEFCATRGILRAPFWQNFRGLFEALKTLFWCNKRYRWMPPYGYSRFLTPKTNLENQRFHLP